MMKEILKASAEELEKVKQYCADDQAENVAQEMFIKGAQWALKNLQQSDVIKSVCENHGTNVRTVEAVRNKNNIL